ncbi:MAG: hypothetical protein ABW032_02715 [Burkholderiaceae bacterium]
MTNSFDYSHLHLAPAEPGAHETPSAPQPDPYLTATRKRDRLRFKLDALATDTATATTMKQNRVVRRNVLTATETELDSHSYAGVNFTVRSRKTGASSVSKLIEANKLDMLKFLTDRQTSANRVSFLREAIAMRNGTAIAAIGELLQPCPELNELVDEAVHKKLPEHHDEPFVNSMILEKAVKSRAVNASQPLASGKVPLIELLRSDRTIAHQLIDRILNNNAEFRADFNAKDNLGFSFIGIILDNNDEGRIRGLLKDRNLRNDIFMAEVKQRPDTARHLLVNYSYSLSEEFSESLRSLYQQETREAPPHISGINVSSAYDIGRFDISVDLRADNLSGLKYKIQGQSPADRVDTVRQAIATNNAGVVAGLIGYLAPCPELDNLFFEAATNSANGRGDETMNKVIFEATLPKVDVNAIEHSTKNSPLIALIKQKNTKQSLLDDFFNRAWYDEGFNINATDGNGIPALDWAVRSNNSSAARHILINPNLDHAATRRLAAGLSTPQLNQLIGLIRNHNKSAIYKILYEEYQNPARHISDEC